jgi:hypothetical protein
MPNLENAGRLWVLGILTTITLAVWAIAQRIGDWKSAVTGRMLGMLAALLTLFLAYLALLWLYNTDVSKIIPRALWEAVGVAALIGALGAMSGWLRGILHSPISLDYVTAGQGSGFRVRVRRGAAYDIRTEFASLDGFHLEIEAPIAVMKENDAPNMMALIMTTPEGLVSTHTEKMDNALSVFHDREGPRFTLEISLKWTDGEAIRDECALYTATFQKGAAPLVRFRRRLRSVVRPASTTLQ